MNKINKIKLKRKQITTTLFNGICFICKKQTRKGFSFHHIGYRSDEKKHSDFTSWVQYNEYVLPIICKMPKKFALLCNKCHRLISILQSIKDNSRFERIVDLARRSR